MVDHHKPPASTQQVLGGLHELGQGDSEFVPCDGFLCIGIEAPMTNGAIRGIAYYSSKHARGKERWHLADVALYNADAVCQAIAGDILLRQNNQRALQFEPHEACMWETAC